jgi:hypothetical protein
LTDAAPIVSDSTVLAVVFGLPGPRTRAAAAALQAIIQVARQECATAEVNSVQDWEKACAAGRNVVVVSQFPSPEFCTQIARSGIPALLMVDEPLQAASLLAADLPSDVVAVRAVSASVACLSTLFGQGDEIIRQSNASNLDAFIVRVAGQHDFNVSTEDLERVEVHIGELSRLGVGFGDLPDVAEPAAGLSELAMAVLPQFGDPVREGLAASIEWPSSLFMLGDRPDTQMQGPVDLAGPARCVLYGPYMHLPSGGWSALVTLELADCFGDRPFTLEIVCGDVIAKGRFYCEGSGAFETRLEFEHCDPHVPIELRLFQDAGEISGAIAAFDINLQLKETVSKSLIELS